MENGNNTTNTNNKEDDDKKVQLIPHHDNDDDDNCIPDEDTYLLRHPSMMPKPIEKNKNKINMFKSDRYGVVVRDAFKKELYEVRKAFVDHVDSTKDGDEYFLEMTMTRTLSLLPSKKEVQELVDGLPDLKKTLSLLPSRRGRGEILPTTDETQQPEEEEEVDYSKSPPLHAYITLATAVVALSSIGPFLDRFQGVPAPMRIVWRMHGTALALAPFALRSVLTVGWPKLTPIQWITFLCASFSYCILTVAFSMAVDYTTVNDAAILTNSQSLLLVIGKLLLGRADNAWEVWGVLIAFSGALLCSHDSSQVAGNTVANPGMSWLGDLLGLLSSIGGIGYIVLGKAVRNNFEVYMFMFLNMTIASTQILLFMYLMPMYEFTFDRNRNIGVFGWAHLSADRLPIEIGTVVICNLCGTMGYVRAFKYFSSVIIAVAALVEPVTAAFIAVALQVGVLPSILGWLGNFMVIGGTIAVLYPTFRSGDQG